jgi:hypothetical protein
MSSPFITFLSTARIGFGTLSFLAPSSTLSLFRVSPVPVPGSAILATRMFGIRDAVLGALLYTADNPAAVRRALIAGAVVDGIDAMACVYGVMNGDIEMLGADLVGGGALVFLAMGFWGLRGLGRGGLKGMGK